MAPQVIDPVEQVAIEVAMKYAVANGYAGGDSRAIGLVLAGMAIASGASTEAQAAILRGYYRQFPAEVGAALAGWSKQLTAAAR